MARLAEVDKNDDVELILFDAVNANDLDLVRDFIADVPRFHDKLLRQAVKSSSCEMLEALLNACNSIENIENNVLVQAVRADNLEASRMLLDRRASNNFKNETMHCMNLAIKNDSPEMIKLLLQYNPVQQEDRHSPNFLCWMMSRGADASREARVIQCLSLLRDWTREKQAFEKCFNVNAQRGCSIAIAEYLLQNGVAVNSRANHSNTALRSASSKSDKRAAELMKFLLESGADSDDNGKANSKPIKDRRGPRNISKWLGISWEQLVEESRKKYVASLETERQ